MGIFDGIRQRRENRATWGTPHGGRTTGMQVSLPYEPLEESGVFGSVIDQVQGGLDQYGQASGTGNILPGAGDYLQGQIAGEGINQNPYLDAQYASGADDIRNRMALFGQSIGATGNPQLAGVFGDVLSDYRNNLYGQQYQFDRGLQHRAAEFAPQFSQAQAGQPFWGAQNAMSALQPFSAYGRGSQMAPHTPFLNALNTALGFAGNVIGLGPGSGVFGFGPGTPGMPGS